MADGITQPGGGANPILIQNDADTGGGRAAGPYSFAQISTAFPALCVDLGTTPKTYRMTVSLTNGDGVGTSVTTLKDSDVIVCFDSPRTYSVSATGRSNRFTEFGVLIDGTKDSARAGCVMMFGTACTIQGNAKIYGSILRVPVGSLTLAPGQTGLNYEIVTCVLVSTAGAVSVGVSATANVTSIYNTSIVGGSAALGAIANFGADSAERLSIALNAAGTYHFRTNSVFSVKDVVMIGIGPGTGAQLRVGGAGTTLIAPTWEQGLTITDGTHSANVDEYWPYGASVIDQNADPIAGLSFTLMDGLGNTVINATTNASGGVTFGAGNTANCVNVVSYPGGVTHTYKGPYTVRINQGPVNTSWPQITRTFEWPTTATWLTTNVQYQDMFDIFQLVPPGGGPTGWAELSM